MSPQFVMVKQIVQMLRKKIQQFSKFQVHRYMSLAHGRKIRQISQISKLILSLEKNSDVWFEF